MKPAPSYPSGSVLVTRQTKPRKDRPSKPVSLLHAPLRILLLLVVTIFWTQANAQVEPVSVRTPTTSAWTGQQLIFYVDIRVDGSFGGATSFSLPQLPSTFIQKVGNPTISSENIEGKTYFVQTHKLIIFSQQTGTLVVPPFPVRYGHKEGYTGPVTEYEGTVPSSEFEIRRPPGTEDLGFLVTTDSLEISETWDPTPTDAQAGTVFKRTIRQAGNQISGMALAPLPKTGPEGIRVYTEDPVVQDNTDRGAFRGERTETLSYFLQEPGAYTLPEIRFAWWNPEKEIVESTTLPSTTFTVTPNPNALPSEPEAQSYRLWKALALVAFLAVVAALLQRPARRYIARLEAKRNSPKRIATRKLMAACEANDARAAYAAYLAIPEVTMSQSLASELKTLEAILYSTHKDSTWNGNALAIAFKESQTHQTTRQQKRSYLPPLNPLPNNRL